MSLHVGHVPVYGLKMLTWQEILKQGNLGTSPQGTSEFPFTFKGNAILAPPDVID